MQGRKCKRNQVALAVVILLNFLIVELSLEEAPLHCSREQ